MPLFHKHQPQNGRRRGDTGRGWELGGVEVEKCVC